MNLIGLLMNPVYSSMNPVDSSMNLINKVHVSYHLRSLQKGLHPLLKEIIRNKSSFIFCLSLSCANFNFLRHWDHLVYNTHTHTHTHIYIYI